MTYVEAAQAPLRKTGQIKLHGPEDFAAMRRAGQLVAEVLDLLAEHVKPGVATERLDRLVFRAAELNNKTPLHQPNWPPLARRFNRPRPRGADARTGGRADQSFNRSSRANMSRGHERRP